MSAYNLAGIDGILIEEAGRLDLEILQNKLSVSPWVELVDVGYFPSGMGVEISQVSYQPTRYSALSWTAVGAGTTPTISTLASAKDDSSYQLYEVAIHSERLDLNDLRTAAMAEAQLTAIRDNLSFNTHRLLEERNRSEYMRVCQVQVVLDSLTAPSEGSIVSGLATLPTAAPAYELTNAVLTKYRQRLIRMGAGDRALDKIDNQPIFGVICDSEISDALKAELGENLRFAGRSNELLAPLGVEGTYKGFFHICDDLMPRYTYSGTTPTEIYPEVDAAAGNGTKRIANSAYDVAPFTDVILFHQDVMKIRVPNAKEGREAGGVSFAARDYRGVWSWENWKSHNSSDSATYNPDNARGFFRGVITQATNIRKNLFGIRLRVYRPGFAP